MSTLCRLERPFISALAALVAFAGGLASAPLTGAEGVPTKQDVNQYIGQTDTEGLTETVYQANFGEQYLAQVAASYAGMLGGMTPPSDPDPQPAIEITQIITNEDTTTPAEIVEEVVYDEVMETLDVPEITQPQSNLPDTMDPYQSDECPSGLFGIVCRLFD